MMRYLPLMLLLVAGVAAAGGNWLTKATTAIRTTDYRGTLVYLRDGTMDTLRIIHRYRNGTVWERLIAKSGQRREIIRKNGRVKVIVPKREVAIITESARGRIFPGTKSVERVAWDEHYRVRVLGKRRQASRMCRVIMLQAKDQYRYSYRLLIDIKTNLPLKLGLLYNQKVLEQMMFTSISFPEHIPDSALDSKYLTEDYRRVRHLSTNQTSVDLGLSWRASQLPPGFVLAEIGVRRIGEGRYVRQLLFTDGVATVSAFVVPSNGPHRFTGETSMGAVNAYGRLTNGYQITVVGEVPDVTVRMIAKHMHSVERPAVSAR